MLLRDFVMYGDLGQESDRRGVFGGFGVHRVGFEVFRDIRALLSGGGPRN